MQKSAKHASVKEDISPNPPKKEYGNESESSSSPTGVVIATSWLLVTVPIAALTVVFLVMVFQYRVTHTHSPFENLRDSSTVDEKNVVYVDMSSSVILFVTSWASSLAPMLSGFLMALASFPIARLFSTNIQKGRAESLPTPYQLGLTLKFLDGSALAAIWSWSMYIMTWKKVRKPQAPILVAAASVAVLATILGALVSAADTWLHLTTTTVPFTHISPVAQPANYGFGLIRECLRGNNSAAAQATQIMDHSDPTPCSMVFARIGRLRNPGITLQLFSNSSSDVTVNLHTTDDGKPYAYFGIPSDTLAADHDFTAHTYAAHTSCSMISQRCDLHVAASSNKFNCSSAFNGLLTDSTLYHAFYTNKTEKEDTFANFQNPGTDNPYYFSMASRESSAGDGVSEEDSIPGGTKNKDFVSTQQGAETFILGCNSTVYDVEYDIMNGSVTRFDTRVSNTSVSNIWQATTANADSDWVLAVKQTMAASLFSTNSSQDFANMVALSYSKASMAMGAQGIEHRPTTALQTRHTTLVARIPLAPLIALVACSLLFVVTGLLLTAMAIWAARSEEVRHIQASLGITGLVADRFENRRLKRDAQSTDGFFAENVGEATRRIAIEADKEMGAHRYTSWI